MTIQLVVVRPFGTYAKGDVIALEPLATLRQPTMWPHRPKRLPNELFISGP